MLVVLIDKHSNNILSQTTYYTNDMDAEYSGSSLQYYDKEGLKLNGQYSNRNFE